MGLATPGIPGDITLELARLNDATVFVETGTFRGETTRWASQYFGSVYTIEKAEGLYSLYNRELAQLKGVKPLWGDSRNLLPSVIAEIGARNAIFWLDGHWSGGETAGEDDECPVLGELGCLSGRAQDVVLIDDAHLFLCAPPSPHQPSQWPTIVEIVQALSSPPGRPYIQIVDDVIFAIPQKEPLKSCLIGYAQQRGDSFWRKWNEIQNRNTGRSVLKALASRVGLRRKCV